ncbi:MAG: hypothetical protein L3J28_00455 [Candidatus Polarisedimenticolaceae bacterium]|nr:hypothetical protein [Candidatus Polarisedimenticolaceae bacterium]
MKKILQTLSAIALATASMTVSATIYDLDSIPAVSGAACTTSSVEGNNGGSDDCWGAFKGNPSQAGNILETSDINYLFTSKIDITGDGVDSSNNDWSIVFDTGSETSGTYTISDSLMASIGDFLLVSSKSGK